MKPYLLFYKTLFPSKYQNYLDRAGGNVDMCHETLLHGTFYEEYQVYGFADKSENERRTYLTDAVRDRLCHRVNTRQGERIVANKYLTYCRLQQFYHRKTWLLQDQQTIDKVIAYGQQHGKLVVKPVDNCGGRGVQLLHASDEYSWRTLIEHHRGQLAEECIPQDERMAKWNHSSINTVRINTFNRHGQIKIFTAFLLTGRDGSFVNNGAQGGLFASIDTDNGIIFTDAYDEHGIAHSVHPDSGIPYKGEPIPCWRALVDLSKSMAENIPEMTYIGWDMALTPDGWEPGEANRGEFIAQQLTQGRGLRPACELMCGIR